MSKVPISFIVDDAPINASYFMRKQMKDRGLPIATKGHFNELLSRWEEMEGCKIIPNTFWKKFIKWALKEGVKGKFTFLPCPAGLGYINDKVEGYTKEELSELIGLIKEEYTKNFDITPEILTHSLAWDIKRGELLAITEHEWTYDKSEEVLTEYMAFALKILKDVGIIATGITQPCNFKGDENIYARAVLNAQKRINDISTTYYFIHSDGDSLKVNSPIVISNKDKDEFVVSIVSGSRADEPFWETIYGDRGDVLKMADYYISKDGKSGRFIDLLSTDSPLIFHAHPQTLYSNGKELGFLSLMEVVNRVNKYLKHKVEWMSMSEFISTLIKREIYS